MSDNDVEVKFGAQIRDLVDGAKEARESIRGFVDQVKEVSEAIGLAFVVDKVIEWKNEVLETNVALERTQAMLGVSGEQAAALDLIAKATGSSMEGITLALSRMAVGMQGADGQSSKLGAALKELGINSASFANLSNEQRLDILAEKFSRLVDGPTKTALAMDIFGRAGASMIPILNQGAAGIEFYAQMSERAGDSTERFKAQFDDLNASTVEMRASMEGLGVEVVGQLSPGILALQAGISGMEQEVRQSLSQMNGWGSLIKDVIGPSMKWLGKDMIGAGADFANSAVDIESDIKEMQKAGAAFSKAWQRETELFTQETNSLGQAWGAFEHIITDGFTETLTSAESFYKGLVKMADDAVEKIGQGFSDLGVAMKDAFSGDLPGASAALENVRNDFGSIGATITKDWQGAIDGISFSKTDEDIENLKKYTSSWASSAESEITNIKQLWGELADNHKAANTEEMRMVAKNDAAAKARFASVDNPITPPAAKKQTETASLPNMTKTKADTSPYEMEVSAMEEASKRKQAILDDELKNHVITSQEWLKQTEDVLSQEYAAEMATYQKELQQANLTKEQKTKILGEEQKAHEKYLDAIQKAEIKHHDDEAKRWQDLSSKIGSSLSGALKGVVTGTQNIAQAGMSILNSLAETAIDAGAKIVEQWAANELATLAGQESNATTSIGISAAQTFAGVMANLAPELGPAAIGPATAAQAAVESVGNAIYDTGAWSVSGDQLAAVHQGEVIIPSRGGMADEFRSIMANGGFGGGKGGGDTHVHIHATDAQSFMGLLKSNGRELTKLVAETFNSNPSMRPTY